MEFEFAENVSFIYFRKFNWYMEFFGKEYKEDFALFPKIVSFNYPGFKNEQAMYYNMTWNIILRFLWFELGISGNP